MDTFDVADAQEAPARRRSSGLIWNILTVLVLIAAVCLASVILMILFNPNSSFNPYPPPTEVFAVVLPQPTVTNTPRLVLEPSWTPTPEEFVPSETPRPTNTPFVTDTPFGMVAPTATRTPTPAKFSIVLQQGYPIAIQYWDVEGCNWMGVGGQVFDLSGSPVSGLIVHLGGTLGSQTFDQDTVTGFSDKYGPESYEFKLADSPIASTKSLWIQVRDQAGLPMSDKLYFDTYAACNQNLIIIYFQQIQ